MKKMEATAELKKESEEEVVVVNGGSSSSSAPNTTSSSSFGKLPRRLQRRLVEESQKRSIQQIQSKLQEAHLRRQVSLLSLGYGLPINFLKDAILMYRMEILTLARLDFILIVSCHVDTGNTVRQYLFVYCLAAL